MELGWREKERSDVLGFKFDICLTFYYMEVNKHLWLKYGFLNVIFFYGISEQLLEVKRYYDYKDGWWEDEKSDVYHVLGFKFDDIFLTFYYKGGLQTPLTQVWIFKCDFFFSEYLSNC